MESSAPAAAPAVVGASAEVPVAAPAAQGQAGAARYTYEPPWPMYSLAWASQPNPMRLAIGSYIESESNKVQVVELNEESQRLEMVAESDHLFLGTKLMWRPSPPQTGSNFDLLVSTTTTLNMWRYEANELKPVVNLSHTRARGAGGLNHMPPLTSFDWSAVSNHKICVSSVDSTCTIWNVEKQKIETQLIAHDKAVVNDIVLYQPKDCLFATAGADGSMRMFDTRNLDHSTIMFEEPKASPLLRLAWSSVNKYHIATIAEDIPGVILIDIRRPSRALGALLQQDLCVNHLAWAPHSANHLLCGTDDGLALIWDVNEDPARKKENEESSTTEKTEKPPLFWHDAKDEIYQVMWPSAAPDHVCLGMAKGVEIMQL